MSNTIYRTLCQLCHSNCGLIVTRDADGALHIAGDPEHPMNRGYHCPKALANVEIVRAPDRLRYPLKKTASGFQRLSWDDALDFAAEKLGELRTAHGPYCLARCGGAPVSYQGRDGFLQFMGEFGSPNFTGVGNLCMAPRMTAFKAVTGEARAEPDYDNTRLVIFWGSNPLGVQRFASYAAHNGFNRIIPRLKKRGVRLICIDPFKTPTAKVADDWIRIRPGTDSALGLAMIHVIVREELYDREFVTAFIDGFAELADHVRACDPAWAEGLTGIPAAVIGELARSYAGSGPAAIHEGNGLDMYAGGVDSVRTIAILILLTGNLDTPGGNVFMPFPHTPHLPTNPTPEEKRIWYEKFPLFPQVPFPGIKESLLQEEEYRPRAMIVHHANPVLTQANERRTRQALAKLDFLIACDIFPTATTEMADMVLPITCGFESYGYRAYSSSDGGFLALARPVAEPAGEARSIFEVEYALAARMGLHHNYPFTDDRSWVENMVRAAGVGFDRLDAEQIVFTSGKVRYRKYRQGGFSTPSGKLQLYSHHFAKKGASPLPVYSDPAGEPLDAATLASKGFTLLGTSRRPPQFVHTKFRNLGAIARTYPEPLLYLHPEDGCKRNIRSGDEVEVRSAEDSIRLRARLMEETTPGLVWIDFGWGNPTDNLASINRLTSDACVDPVSGGTPNRLFPCEVRRAPLPRAAEPAASSPHSISRDHKHAT